MHRRFLKTPLLEKTSLTECNRHWDKCVQENLPYVTFQKGRKYGEYSCDLLPLNGLRLTEEGRTEIMGIFEAAYSRWLIDQRLPKNKQTIHFSTGPVYICITPCPAGEEAYIHHAICRVLAKHVEGERSNKGDDEHDAV